MTRMTDAEIVQLWLKAPLEMTEGDSASFIRAIETEVRRRALEEAATLCEEIGDAGARGELRMEPDCAAQIRGLI